MNNKIKKLYLNYYFVLSIIGTLCCILWVYFIKTKPISDFNYYNQLAAQIANGGSLGDTRQAIGYPIVLAIIYKIFGQSITIAKVFNILLTFLNYNLFSSILKKIEYNEKFKKVVFALFVFFPSNIFLNSVLAKEIFLTTIILLITNEYLKGKVINYIFMGILIGIGTIVHASLLIYFIAILIVDIVVTRNLKKSLLYSFIILLFSAIVISPMIYRNTKFMGQLTYVSTNSGLVLYINNNSQNTTGTWMPPANVANSVVSRTDFKNGNRAIRCKIFKSAARNWILTHPKRFVELGFIRLKNTYFKTDDLFWTYPNSGLSNYEKHILYLTIKTIRMIIFIPALIYAFILSLNVLKGIFTKSIDESKNINKFRIYELVIFYMFTCIHFITEGQSRYFFPLIFIMVSFFLELIKIVCPIHHLNLEKEY